jgi:hypothetical protein
MVGEKYQMVTDKDWGKTAFLLFIFVMVMSLSSIILFAEYWYFWLLIVVGGMTLIVTWHAKNFAYRCPGCGEIFEVSTMEDFFGPNGVNKKYLRCSKCGKRAWAEILRIK